MMVLLRYFLAVWFVSGARKEIWSEEIQDKKTLSEVLPYLAIKCGLDFFAFSINLM